jgi:hypothetical protein
MSSGPRSAALLLGAVSLLSLPLACKTGNQLVRLPDGSYELKCEGPLSTCLMQMENACKDDGYEVLRATEKRDRVGPMELQTEIVRSEGLVRCRRADALFTPAPPASGPPPAAPTATDAPPMPDHPPLPPIHAPPATSAPAPSSAPPPSSSPPPAPAPPAPAPAEPPVPTAP